MSDESDPAGGDSSDDPVPTGGDSGDDPVPTGGDSGDQPDPAGDDAGDQPDPAVGDPDDEPAIRALDAATVQRIAAGEVVERPASVVKELVENSLDAGASRVQVAVETGGTEGIRVRDDGAGMTAAELRLAVREHHTSKIGDIDDLEAGVGTLGFRGEALHAIGAVSRTTVRSKPRDAAAEHGHELTVEGGETGEVRPAGCPPGTTVEVEDLFFNVPARRKFLKTVATEFDHVNTVVTQYALANPDVAVSLEHDGREVFATEGNGDRRSAVLAVYGREVAEAMVRVDAEPDGPVAAVRGLVSHPETTRAGREYLSTFVNGRYVTTSTLREAVLDAYGGQLATDRYPFSVLFVEVDPAAVDVNVHPRKLEVRFDDEPAVKTAVREAVREALLDHGLLRSTAPRGRSKADEAAVSPGSAGESSEDGADSRDSAGVTATESTSDRQGAASPDSAPGPEPTTDDAAPSEPVGGDASTAEPAAGDTPPTGPVDADVDEDDWAVDLGEDSTASESADTAGAGSGRPSPRSWQSEDPEVDPGGGSDDADADIDAHAGIDANADIDAHTDTDAATGGESGSARGDPHAARPSSAADLTRAAGFAEPTSQRTLAGDEAAPGGEFDSLPALRVLGQLHDTYVVAESDRGLVLVDQHAADERVNYERLRREFRGGATAQALADPVELELTAREAELFESHADELGELGFRAERAGERTVAVESVPAVFDAALDPGLLRDVLTAFVRDEVGGGAETVDDVADDLLADLACYPSVTGNTSLTEGSVADLLEALDACENPYACPHGRPVVIELAESEIQDRFERDYPGHGGRRREE